MSITKLVVAAECVIALKFYFFYSTSWRLYHKIILGCTGYVISVVRNSFLIDYTFFLVLNFLAVFQVINLGKLNRISYSLYEIYYCRESVLYRSCQRLKKPRKVC